MATDCDYPSSAVTLAITCEGTLGDPRFPRHFQKIIDRLDDLLGVPVKVRKLEPWNSVRVTLSVPREAALQLRQLAQQGAPQLRALGILSVQLDGEGAVSLKLRAANGEPQELVLRPGPPRRPDPSDGAGGANPSSSPSSSSGATTAAAVSAASALGLGALLPPAAAASVGGGQVPFKSPNVVCPPDTVVPRVGAGLPAAPNPLNKPPYAGPFPFASMNQAIHSQSSNTSGGPPSMPRPQQNVDPPSFLPPPYPGVRRPGASPGSLPPVRTAAPARSQPRPLSDSVPLQTSPVQQQPPPVTISSPLLVNLLQNDHQPAQGVAGGGAPSGGAPRQMRPPPPPVTAVVKAPPPPNPQTVAPLKTAALPHPGASPNNNNNNHVTSQANVLVSMSNNNTSSLSSSSSVSPSALITSVAPSLGSATQTSFGSLRNAQEAVGGPPRVQHYQRTPQGSIIAVNKPLQNALPLHQQNHRQGQGVIRPQFAGLQKTGPSFMPNNVQPHAAKMTPGHVNNLLNSNSAIGPSAGGHTPPLGGLGLVLQQQMHPLAHNDVLSHQVVSQTATTGKPLPSPPPYSVAVSSRPHWDSIVSNPAALLDLPSSLTDLKPDELDDLLPALSHSPLPELSELELLGGPHHHQPPPPPGPENGLPETNDGRKYLINPLTGELEPHSSDESDVEEVKDVFTDLPSPLGMSDEDTSSTTRPDTTTDQSDSETRSSTDGKHSRVKNAKARREGRDSPALKPTEKIKLRLKLEKSEPVNPAYKVDISFVNAQQPKKAAASVVPAAQSAGATPAPGEELRVPPLHISLRGRNSAVIKNKSKGANSDGTKKVRKLQMKAREGDDDPSGGDPFEHKKIKKQKSNNHEHRELLAALADDPAKFAAQHNHYKEKQKERRGSDSELVRAGAGRKHEANGALMGDEKRRRLSQSEGERRADDEAPLTVLGSTNVGTVGVLPQKVRKEKIKIKESFKVKDHNRKLYATAKAAVEKSLQQKSTVALPTATDLDMESKFKQSLMEGAIGEKGVPRPPHRTTEVVGHATDPGGGRPLIPPEKIPKIPLDVVQTKEKTPEPDKCNVPDRKAVEALQEGDKQLNAIVTAGSRSPNSGSNGGQGEDSGIESMDALSEKSPNQASQSPHGDILPNNLHPPITSKTQVPDMLDIESQLAKMEGLEHHDAGAKGNESVAAAAKTTEGADKNAASLGRTGEDVNENECVHRSDSKSCCDLTCTLQDKVEDKEDGVVAVLKGSKKDDQQSPNSPPSLRVAPSLYAYPSNPVDKGGGGSRGSSESPLLTTEDEDSNPGAVGEHTQVNNKGKSLLEQLLIEIPSEHHGAPPSSHSPATRSSVRTRALSKLGSPELSSPVPKTAKNVVAAKRKRNESDSSNHSVEEARKRPRKGSEASEVGKQRLQQPAQNSTKKNSKTLNSGTGHGQQDESSDSDEPLIEKLRKTGPKQQPPVKVAKVSANVAVVTTTTAATTPAGAQAAALNNKTNTRRSARSGQQEKQQQHQQQLQQPAQNTRSREKVGQQQGQQGTHSSAEAEAAALRRKTRSADVESKRKKEVK